MRRSMMLMLMLSACGEGDDAAEPDATPVEPGDNGTTTYTEEMIGTPVFRMVDWQHYAGPMGTVPGAPEWFDTLIAVWTRHRHDAGNNLIAPYEVHAPPYDTEVSLGMTAAGFDPGDVFPMSDWVKPSGLTLTGVMIPAEGAPMGRSTDFENGPIIPETIFPLHVDADLYKGATLLDPYFDSDYPLIDDVLPSANADGWSHMPMNFGESTIFIAGNPGDYEYVVVVTDRDGNGWRVRIPFTITN